MWARGGSAGGSATAKEEVGIGWGVQEGVIKLHLCSACALTKTRRDFKRKGKKKAREKTKRKKKPAKTSAFSLLDAPRGLIRVRIRAHFFFFFLTLPLTCSVLLRLSLLLSPLPPPSLRLRPISLDAVARAGSGQRYLPRCQDTTSWFDHDSVAILASPLK